MFFLFLRFPGQYFVCVFLSFAFAVCFFILTLIDAVDIRRCNPKDLVNNIRKVFHNR